MSDNHILPHNWHWKRLGEYINSTKNGYGRRPQGIEDGPIVLRLADVAQGRIDLSNTRRVAMASDERAAYGLRKGDILFTRVNGSREAVAQCILVDDDYDDIAFNDHLIRVRLKPGLLSEYLFMVMLFPPIRSRLLAFIPPTMGGQLTINQQNLASCEIPLPPLPEQRAIAAILGTWDRAITLTERRLAAAEQRKQALMQQLLTGRVRFPEFAGEAWREVRLGEVFARVTRKTPPNVTNILSISARIGFEHQADKFSRVIAGDSLSRYILLRRGEFAYNKGNSKAYPQGCIYRLEDHEEGAVPNVYYCFKAKSNAVNGLFYKYYFESGALNPELRGFINAGVRNDGLLNLNVDDFFNCTIVLPSPAEQERIASVLDAATREIELLRRKRDALQRQKRGLMQRLLTGRVRVGIAQG